MEESKQFKVLNLLTAEVREMPIPDEVCFGDRPIESISIEDVRSATLEMAQGLAGWTNVPAHKLVVYINGYEVERPEDIKKYPLIANRVRLVNLTRKVDTWVIIGNICYPQGDASLPKEVDILHDVKMTALAMAEEFTDWDTAGDNIKVFVGGDDIDDLINKADKKGKGEEDEDIIKV